jgi:beta-amylase
MPAAGNSSLPFGIGHRMPDASVRHDNLSPTAKLESELASGCQSVIDSAADFGRGFGHEAAKPIVGLKQAVFGKSAKEDARAPVVAAGSEKDPAIVTANPGSKSGTNQDKQPGPITDTQPGTKTVAVDPVELDTGYTVQMILANDFSHPLARKSAAQAAAFKSAESIQLKPEESSSFKVGGMAGQAFDFLALTLLCKNIPKIGKSGLPGILAAGGLAALNPTEHGGRDWLERGKSALSAVVAVGSYELFSRKLKANGLASGFLAGTAREVISSAVAGSESAQLESKLKTGHWASGTETLQGAAGWVLTGTALHSLGAGFAKFFPKGAIQEGSLSISRAEPAPPKPEPGPVLVENPAQTKPGSGTAAIEGTVAAKPQLGPVLVEGTKTAKQGSGPVLVEGTETARTKLGPARVDATETARTKPGPVLVDATQTARAESAPAQPSREFVVVSGVMKLKSFIHRDVEGSMLKVQEIFKKADGSETLGPKQKLFVQRLGGNEGTLMGKAKKADLIASCHPENLSIEDKAKHVFPDQHGKVWMVLGRGNRLMLQAGDHPVVEWRKQGYVAPFRLDGGNTTINAMAPLVVGDPENLNSPDSQKAWADFDRLLQEAKKMGLHAISTDVWWGLVEKNKQDFNWQYYDKVSDHIIKAGLKWVPILSFHQCGGNVGDNVNISLPEWVWKEIADKAKLDPEALKFKSEQGHTSKEFISFWADHLAKEHYESVMQNFQNHFGGKARNIGEINISMGPAGEMRYPSYNAHDPDAGYPTRGRLQAYSELAVKSFRDWALKKYNGIEGLRTAWGLPALTEDQIQPPSDAQGFFDRNDHINLQYGRDFFDWYSDSLIDHGRTMLSSALNVFGQKGSSFYGIDIGAKIPGVHWRFGHYENGAVVFEKRLAELAAGLIRTSLGDWYKNGHGYNPILSMVKDVQPGRPGQGNRIVPAFTCLELPDGQDAEQHPESLPHTLATWVGQAAEDMGLWLKGENALSGALYNNFDWDLMDNLLDLPNQFNGTYHGLTFLRLGDVVDNPVARAKINQIMQAIREDELHPQRLIDKLNKMFASVKKAA